MVDKLEEARKIIDEVDEKMAELFTKRMKAVEMIFEHKKKFGLPILEQKREDALIEKNATLVQDETIKGYYIDYLKDVMAISKAYQYRMQNGLKVAYSGVPGAFAYIAAGRIFRNGNRISHRDFKEAYQAVVNGECDVAVLPIENSYAGEVGQTIDLLFSGPLFINGIYELQIQQNLLGVPGAIVDDIKKVTSHQQALGQCHDYIKLRNLEVEEATNTAVAAKMVAEKADKTLGAIASVETADIYGLKVLEANINKSAENTTRFAVFSKVKADTEAFSNSVLMFTVKNEAGALAKTLNIIGSHGFNMRSLRSRPMKELIWNYYFYVELEGNINSQEGKDMLRALNIFCDKLKVVGIY